MIPSITLIAYTFYAIAAAVGVPGAAYLAYGGWRRLRRTIRPKPKPAVRPTSSGDGLMEIFNAVDIGLSAVSKVGGAIGDIVAGLLTGIAVAAVLASTLLFFTARGLMHQESWARWVAVALLANVGLLAIGSRAIGRRRRPLRIAASTLISVGCAFAVHSLWHGYR